MSKTLMFFFLTYLREFAKVKAFSIGPYKNHYDLYNLISKKKSSFLKINSLLHKKEQEMHLVMYIFESFS